MINASEMCSLGGALVIMLSIIGINVSALLIPAGVALAIAAKDLSHNFLAGFFLFAVQVRCVVPDWRRSCVARSWQLPEHHGACSEHLPARLLAVHCESMSPECRSPSVRYWSCFAACSLSSWATV